MIATLLLGTNLGDREANLLEARRHLAGILGPEVGSTPVIETVALGFTGPDFLNQVVSFDTAISPGELLAVVKGIERRMGRSETPEYASDGSRIYHDRIIDIDILTFGDIEMDTPELKIPHPQVKTRPFVGKLLTLQDYKNKI